MLAMKALDRLDGVVQDALERFVPAGLQVAFEVNEDGIRAVGVGDSGASLPDRPRQMLAGAVAGWAAQAGEAFGASFLISARHTITPGSGYSDPVMLPDLAFLHVSMMKRGDPRANATQSTLTLRPNAAQPMPANGALNQFFTTLIPQRRDWFEGIVLLQVFTGTRQARWSGQDQAQLTRLYETVIVPWPGPPRKPR
ncbi:MAG: hypothetical protein EAZ99_05335 [Alphaproteobacteria bacterium]|nr:MAG: hypothetical protein EAZ99_05335 [Alphaproteobacteria bacterium]